MVDNSGIEVSTHNQYVHVAHAHTFQIGIVCIHFAWSASYNSMPLSQNKCGARYADRDSVEEMMRGQKVHRDLVSVSKTAHKWRVEWSATAALLSFIACPPCPRTSPNL